MAANSTKKRYRYALLVILLFAVVLRIYGLSRGDTTTDEVSYAFRAAGLMDFDEAADQTTPLEWFDPYTISRYCAAAQSDAKGAGLQNSETAVPKSILSRGCDAVVGMGVDEKATNGARTIPWWTRLSFHDHPPFVFWIQHMSMRLFGETNFGFRFPSAVFGVLSIYLLYCIGKLLYSENAGLVAASILAVTVNHVYLSRTGLQESYVIFFMLLASYFFLRALEQENYFLWTGAALGGAFLTKYTTFFLVPVFLAYLFLRKKEYFFSRKLWLGVLLAALIFSPVIVYNIALYRAVGHFDFQFSFMAGQHPDVWQITPGKDIGTFLERLPLYIPTLIKIHSWIFLLLFTFAVVSFFSGIVLQRRETIMRHGFLFLVFFFLVLLLFRIGYGYRFLSMLTPWMAISTAVFLCWYSQRISRYTKYFLYAGAGLLVLFEIFYSINSQIWYYPKGPAPWIYSSGVRYENYNWGYNNLTAYLRGELQGKMPARVFEMKYHFLDVLHRQAVVRAKKAQKNPYAAVIIYDGNVDHMAQLWVLDRLNIYHAWPVLKVEQYIQYAEANNRADLTSTGFEHYYLIVPTDNVLLRKPESRTLFGKAFEELLVRRGISPERIFNKNGEEAFRVYKF